MAFAQKNGNNWTPGYRIDGKKVYCTAKKCGTFTTKEAAEAHAVECEAQTRSVTPVPVEPSVDPTGPLTKEQKATLDINAVWRRYCKRNKRPELITLENYTAMFERPKVGVLAYFGTQRPDDIEADAVSYWIEAMEAAGLSQGNIRASLMAFSSLMKFAMSPREGIRTKAGNPCHGHGVVKPNREKKDAHFVLTGEQVQRLVEAFDTRGMQVLTATIMGTGARSEEAFALRVEHVQQAQSQVSIHDRVTWPKANPERGHLGGVLVHQDTKAGNVRVVPIQTWLLELLVSWINDNGLERGDLLFPAPLVLPAGCGHGYVDDSELPGLTEEFIATLGTITTPHGHTYQHGTIGAATTARCRCEWCKLARRRYDRARNAKRGATRASNMGPKRELGRTQYLRYRSYAHHFRTAVDKAGLPALMGWRITPHALRHSWISNLANAPGANVSVVSRLAGHKSIETTMLYVHGAPAAERAAVESLPQGYAVAIGGG